MLFERGKREILTQLFLSSRRKSTLLMKRDPAFSAKLKSSCIHTLLWHYIQLSFEVLLMCSDGQNKLVLVKPRIYRLGHVILFIGTDQTVKVLYYHINEVRSTYEDDIL